MTTVMVIVLSLVQFSYGMFCGTSCQGAHRHFSLQIVSYTVLVCAGFVTYSLFVQCFILLCANSLYKNAVISFLVSGLINNTPETFHYLNIEDNILYSVLF